MSEKTESCSRAIPSGRNSLGRNRNIPTCAIPSGRDLKFPAGEMESEKNKRDLPQGFFANLRRETPVVIIFSWSNQGAKILAMVNQGATLWVMVTVAP
jgi:hypothetical protein